MGDFTPTELITTPVAGSPYQPGDMITVVRVIDRDIYDVADFVGERGVVKYLNYTGETGQVFPAEPLLEVQFLRNRRESFWPEEITLTKAAQRAV